MTQGKIAVLPTQPVLCAEFVEKGLFFRLQR